MKHVDVLIVGGSLAGSACVRELSRRGIDAVCIEREQFPRDKVCGGFLSPGAVQLLDQLELLGAVRIAGASVVRSVRVRMLDREVNIEFPESGLGISRRSLDSILADHPAVLTETVRNAARQSHGFQVQLDHGQISARVVVDAAGKFSRWSKRRTSPQYGLQFYQPESRGDIMDFWFFEDGYGGAVSIEGGRSNVCFLIAKQALPRYVRTDVRVTGPLAYECQSGEFISIGDAAGMMDPFCGEGMRHAMDTGMMAARVIADGLHRGDSFDRILEEYKQETGKRWNRKRRWGRILRGMLRHPRAVRTALRLPPELLLKKLWE